MAAIYASFTTAEQALAAATVKTVLQVVVPANHCIRVLGWGVFFDQSGTNAPTNEPVVVTLSRQTTVIGGTPTAVTGVKHDNGAAETLQTTAAMYGGTPTEPTTTETVKRVNVHPQSGYEYVAPMGDEILVSGGASGARIAIICTAPNAVNVIPYINIEE